MTVISSTKDFVVRTATYKGGVGHASWILHRLGGIGIAVFLILHIIDIFMIVLGKEMFDFFLFIYHQPIFRPAIWGLMFGIFYHAVNGVRIIIHDFFPSTFRYQREMVLGAWVIIGILVVLTVGMDIFNWITYAGSH
ncbi:MAG: succinate dehydrogenase, cytochrome b556 subunit [Anaerolineaceae bacterium 4572_78]|nr:MAG: succinate dehydrogenase, cytochrome b556 subunit [Anaerolineaceae bacterium 4572_78]